MFQFLHIFLELTFMHMENRYVDVPKYVCVCGSLTFVEFNISIMFELNCLDFLIIYYSLIWMKCSGILFQ